MSQHPKITPRLGLIMLALLPLWLASSSQAGPDTDPAAKAYHLAQARCHALDFAPHLAQNRPRWLACAEAMQRAYQLNPHQPQAPDILYRQGDLYAEMYQKFGEAGDLNTALNLYQQLASRFPQHPLAAESLFRSATLLSEDRHDPKAAAQTLTRLLASNPKPDLAKAANAMLNKLAQTPPAPQAARDEAQPPARPAAKPGEQAELTDIRPWSNKSCTRVVIETSAPVTFSSHLLKKTGDQPRRLYVNIKNCRLARRGQTAIPVKDGLLHQVRSAQFDPQTVRVVLDAQTISDYKISNLENPFRIVVDVKGTANATLPPLPSPPARENRAEVSPPTTAKPLLPLPKAPPATTSSLAQQLGLSIRRLVIDPGHGGKDPGAIGVGGLKEKDVVLKVAKKVARDIANQMGIQVLLTRSTDVFIPLEERTAIANTQGGDLFISIHANSSKSPKPHGIETYYLDLAGNDAEQGVAALENSASSHQVSDLQHILSSLMQNTKKDESARLAGIVQTRLVTDLGRSYPEITSHGVKKAPFVVLIGAQMPSILTEIAFVSNPLEARRLRDERYIQALADSITDGVVKYAASLSVAGCHPAVQVQRDLAASYQEPSSKSQKATPR